MDLKLLNSIERVTGEQYENAKNKSVAPTGFALESMFRAQLRFAARFEIRIRFDGRLIDQGKFVPCELPK